MPNILIFWLLTLVAGSFMGFYLWKREMWLGIAAGVLWMALAIYAWIGYEASPPETHIFITNYGMVINSTGEVQETMDTLWFGLGWLFAAISLALLVAPLSWNKTKDEIWEESFDPDTGEPMMIEYKQGVKTGKERELTDWETGQRERRNRANESERRSHRAKRQQPRFIR